VPDGDFGLHNYITNNTLHVRAVTVGRIVDFKMLCSEVPHGLELWAAILPSRSGKWAREAHLLEDIHHNSIRDIFTIEYRYLPRERPAVELLTLAFLAWFSSITHMVWENSGKSRTLREAVEDTLNIFAITKDKTFANSVGTKLIPPDCLDATSGDWDVPLNWKGRTAMELLDPENNTNLYRDFIHDRQQMAPNLDVHSGHLEQSRASFALRLTIRQIHSKALFNISGRIGLGPLKTGIHDEVIMSPEYPLLLVIRKTQDHYLYVGHCFVIRLNPLDLLRELKNGKHNLKTFEFK
jgi:hypothetical protein